MKFGAPSLETQRRTVLKWSLFVIVVGIALVIDLVTKYIAEQRLVLGETHEILPFFFLERTTNLGVAFGLLRGQTGVIVAANIVALIIVVTYIYMERRAVLAGVGGGLFMGGGLGNLVQRLSGDGHVTDFLKFPHWPNFNMADVFLVAAISIIVIGLVVETFRVWKVTNKNTGVSP